MRDESRMSIERIDEDSQILVEAHDLIVQLARVGPKSMAHRVGRRERHGEKIRLRTASEVHRRQSRQRELRRQRIHLADIR